MDCVTHNVTSDTISTHLIKKPITAYGWFVLSKKNDSTWKAKHVALVSSAAAEWKAMTDVQKQPFIEMAVFDMARSTSARQAQI